MTEKCFKVGKTMTRPGLVILVLLLVSGCRSTAPKGDPVYLTLMQRGAKAYAGGHGASALSHYEEAFMRALAQNDAVATADAGYNTAMMYAQQNEPYKAGLYIDAAMDVMTHENKTIPWDMLLLKARIMMQQDDIAAAVKNANAALLPAAEAGKEAINEVNEFLAYVYYADKKITRSKTLVTDLLAQKLSPALRAGCLTLQADMEQQTKQYDAAASHYVEAIAYRHEAKQYLIMPRTMDHAAVAFHLDKQFDKAGDYWLQAAAMFYGQQRWIEALTSVKHAMEVADSQRIAQLKRRTDILFALIKQQVDAHPLETGDVSEKKE